MQTRGLSKCRHGGDLEEAAVAEGRVALPLAALSTPQEEDLGHSLTWLK